MTSSTHPETPAFGPDEISEVLRAFESSGWSGLRLRVGDVVLSAGKDAPPPEPSGTSSAPVAPAGSVAAPPALAAPTPAPAAPAPDPTPAPVPVPTRAADIDTSGAIAITSPTVGAFWAAPDPGSPPFVAVGDHVTQGDQVAIVEVMKLMNPVVSTVSGVVVAIEATNAEMVEFGQTLFLVQPDE